MPAVHRKGDMGTGHSPWPPRPNDQGSNNVNVNSIPVHREGDHWTPHAAPGAIPHDSNLAKGSLTVFVNGKGIARIGDPVACGSKCASGSSNVFSG